MKCASTSRRNPRNLLAGIPLAMRMNISRAAGLLRRPIPASGELLPAVGLGTWQVFDVAGKAEEFGQARAALSRFVELGGAVVDSSPMYGASESVLGELAAALAVHKRLFLATKVWTRGRAARRGRAPPRPCGRFQERGDHQPAFCRRRSFPPRRGQAASGLGGRI